MTDPLLDEIEKARAELGLNDRPAKKIALLAPERASEPLSLLSPYEALEKRVEALEAILGGLRQADSEHARRLDNLERFEDWLEQLGEVLAGGGE